MKAMAERNNDTGLDAFFAAAADDPILPPGDLMARVEAEALAEMPRAGAVVASQPGLLAQLMGALGGWPAVAGLAAACVTGVWIGASSPDSLQSVWTATEAGLDGIGMDPVSGFDLALLEG